MEARRERDWVISLKSPHPFVVGQTIDNAIRALRRITKDTPKF
jgi:hypothetical protein